MSDCPGVKCDRCDERAVLSASGTAPDGWSTLKFGRLKPFLNIGLIDLCPTCTDAVYALVRPSVKPA